MAQPVTPYVWKYQPETGYTAGAHQNYNTVINWLHANPQMFARIQHINTARNVMDKFRSDLTRDDIAVNINNWPAEDLMQPPNFPYIPATSKSTSTINDWLATTQGIQLSGTSELNGWGSNRLTSYPDIPPILKYERPGQQLQGQGLFKQENIHLFYESPRLPRSGGLTPQQFVKEFPPVVYNNPFSESMSVFPKEFSPLFNPSESLKKTSSQTLQYK